MRKWPPMPLLESGQREPRDRRPSATVRSAAGGPLVTSVSQTLPDGLERKRCLWTRTCPGLRKGGLHGPAQTAWITRISRPARPAPGRAGAALPAGRSRVASRSAGAPERRQARGRPSMWRPVCPIRRCTSAAHEGESRRASLELTRREIAGSQLVHDPGQAPALLHPGLGRFPEVSGLLRVAQAGEGEPGVVLGQH